MPILMTLDDLRTGMRLAEPFMYLNRVMLPQGKKLNSADIDVLRRLYPSIHVKVGHPLLDSMVKFEEDRYDRDLATRAQSQIAQAVMVVERRMSMRMELSPGDFMSMQQTARGAMKYLAENPITGAILCNAFEKGSYLADHTASVFFLSMSLGHAVKAFLSKQKTASHETRTLLASMDLTPLGLGSMFCDVGMFQMAELIEDKNRALTDQDRKKLNQHPRIGAEMLPDSFPELGRLVVRTHHENFDGSGYPEGLHGKDQHLFTRIVRICDSFDAATSQRAYRQAKTPTRVLWEMAMGPNQHFYDPVLMKIFISLIQPFPIGARLTLSDGRLAVVVGYNHQSPFRPTVVITTDEHGQQLPPHRIKRQVKLAFREDLRIVAFGHEDLSYLNEDVDMEEIEERMGLKALSEKASKVVSEVKEAWPSDVETNNIEVSEEIVDEFKDAAEGLKQFDTLFESVYPDDVN